MVKSKSASLKGLRAKYGLKPRKKYTAVHFLLKKRRRCIECGSSKFLRQSVGIWTCKKCGFKIAGLAYDIQV